MNNSKFFAGKVVVLSGASSGIGRATALALSSYGARMVLVSRNEEKLNIVKEEIVANEGKAIVVKCDVGAADETRRVASVTVSEFGRADILIACAGKYVQDTSCEIGLEAYHDSLSMNFFGTLNVISSFLPQMKKQGGGHIVIINSLDSSKGIVGDGPYVAAKCALDGFGDVFRQEMKPFSIKVTSVYPGRVDTPMIGNIKVPAISAKIRPVKVTKAIIRGIKRNRALVVVPGSYALIGVLNKIAPKLLDRLYKIFRLEGELINK